MNFNVFTADTMRIVISWHGTCQNVTYVSEEVADSIIRVEALPLLRWRSHVHVIMKWGECDNRTGFHIRTLGCFDYNHCQTKCPQGTNHCFTCHHEYSGYVSCSRTFRECLVISAFLIGRGVLGP